MKRLPIIGGIILVLLLSSITPIASMKLNDGWVYDEDTGTLSIEFSGETEESYILKYGLIECSEVGFIFNISYSFPENSLGFIEASYNHGETWNIFKEYYKSNQDLRDLFVTLTTESLWIRFSVESISGDGYCIIHNIEIIGDSRGNPPKTWISIAGSFTFWHSSLQVELIAYDNINGVKEIHYLLFGKEFIVEGSSTYFVVKENGIHTLIVWSIDKNGNEEVPQIVPYLLRIDNAPPKLEVIQPQPGLYLFGKKIPISINKTIILGDFDMDVIAVDEPSGLYKIQYILDGDIIDEATGKPYLRICRVKHNGGGKLMIIAEDFAGNSVGKTLDIYYYNFF